MRKVNMSSIDKSGTYALGTRTVKRLGYGAMQLAGPGVFGRRRISRPRWTCYAKPWRRG
jgi:hypothetical protein